MDDQLIVTLDVGKTLAKLSLWRADGTLTAREARANARLDAGGYLALDAAGIEAWAAATLTQFAKRGRVGAIIPVAHGAAFAIVRSGQLACPPLDYEQPIPAAVRAGYDAERDAFADTGSPALPDGLNLGAQLHYLEQIRPDLLTGDALILPWAQYWAWRLSGVAASEVTSLGSHTDLWRPRERRASNLARARGWARRLAPLASAGDVLGTLTAEWVDRTGLPADMKVYCGLHDSNAALLAARGFREIRDQESTVLSTGTWFVAMRSPKGDRGLQVSSLPEARDCLVNVDAWGKLIPSARFMGGREIEVLTGLDTQRIDTKADQPLLVQAVRAVIDSGARALPSFAAGVGPFPGRRGRWIDMPTDQFEQRAAVCLYAALMADVSLDLIGAKERVLVEGRFARSEVFVRGLAALRPKDAIYVSNANIDVSYGALRLLHPTLEPAEALVRVRPLDMSLDGYRDTWRRDVERMEHTV